MHEIKQKTSYINQIKKNHFELESGNIQTVFLIIYLGEEETH